MQKKTIRYLVALDDTDIVLSGVCTSPKGTLPIQIELDADSAKRYGHPVLEMMHVPDTVEDAQTLNAFEARQIAQKQAPKPSPTRTWKPSQRADTAKQLRLF